ncbi:MAG: hypothetical protein O7A03_06035, partial [Alphaproteobacteria bacterium]|nr:hypothetical protein [Alphaproteobacteria bacterium]
MSEFFDMDFGPLTGLAAASFMAVFVGIAIAVGIARRLLLRWQVLDVPNQRSSHDRPTPRGGGIGVLAVLLPVWIYWLSLIMDSGPLTGIGGAALLLAAISWIDDLKGLGAALAVTV